MNNKKTDWCAEWFGSLYYRVLYKHRDEKEAENFLHNLFDFLHPEKKLRILDLACGRGRHTHYLAQKGFDVTGIDISEANILFAKQNSSAEFLVCDSRTVFKKNHFDIILNLFTSFGYFESENDDLQVLNAVHSQLKRNGIFVLDFMNAKKAIANLKKEESIKIDKLKFQISRGVKNGFICKKISVKKQIFEERVKALTLEDFKKYFSKTGFKIKHIFGDYDLSIFDEKYSDRLLFIAKKC